MSFQVPKSFVHLGNTNEYLFDEIWGISVPPFDSYTAETLMLQKVYKEIVKVIQMNLSGLFQIF